MSTTYTTAQGDMWDLIAYKTLGDTKYTNLLMSANLAYRDYFVFPAGIVLQIPNVSVHVVTASPPWKKAGG